MSMLENRVVPPTSDNNTVVSSSQVSSDPAVTIKHLFRDLISLDSVTVANKFVDTVIGIDKARWTVGNPDPVEEVLSYAQAHAPSEFWQLFRTKSVDLKSMIPRVRNWISSMMRAGLTSRVLPGLQMLKELPISEEKAAEIKMYPVLKRLCRGEGAGSDVARELARRFKYNFSAPVATLPKPKETDQIFIRKRQMNQAPSASAARPSFASLKAQLSKRPRPESNEAKPSGPAKKQKLKSVKFQPDRVLVRVKFFDKEDCPIEMSEETFYEPSSANSSHLLGLEFGEGDVSRRDPWRPPILLRIPIPEDLRSVMGIKRGGLVSVENSEKNSSPDQPDCIEDGNSHPPPRVIPMFSAK